MATIVAGQNELNAQLTAVYPIVVSNAQISVAFLDIWGGLLQAVITYDAQADRLYDTVYNPQTGLYEPWIIHDINLSLTNLQGAAIASAIASQAIPRPITTTKQTFQFYLYLDWAGRAVDFAAWIRGSLINYSFSIQIKIAGILMSNVLTGSGQLRVS